MLIDRIPGPSRSRPHYAGWDPLVLFTIVNPHPAQHHSFVKKKVVRERRRDEERVMPLPHLHVAARLCHRTLSLPFPFPFPFLHNLAPSPSSTTSFGTAANADDRGERGGSTAGRHHL